MLLAYLPSRVAFVTLVSAMRRGRGGGGLTDGAYLLLLAQVGSRARPELRRDANRNPLVEQAVGDRQREVQAAAGAEGYAREVQVAVGAASCARRALQGHRWCKRSS